MGEKFDPKAENEKFNVQQRAQQLKMGNADPVLNPKQMQRSNEPNAGGENREAGDRKARQNDRATNGGE
ncbi:hypothetical protein EQ718_18740 (plasmid) [Paracoccus versutus]|uniref:Uncharacterized protein n=1 Tax=Paracoccus versutus TaxID=34007 RepID=A0A369TWI2_PARVE|nr:MULTISPECIES: hypothetical protein [Paracoccus]WGR62505.1 hypothetical protein E3U26_17245 [Paracoccus ferrooxidans]SFY07553.1 hypothetical protein SAMN04244548_02661 [Paracoccus pantotrophus]MBT0781704.1 hypothetical protein [Paracoccus sp. pheM1]MCJ1900939.1 hypothetical protein [Paracoccus versutus]MDF3906163.1 hypothetical protein [Paracoccus sp. AS002]